MHRLLVSPDQLESDSPVLSKEAAAHLRVVRPKEGELIELFDGRGRWRCFRVKNVDAKSFDIAAVSDMERQLQPTIGVTLFACVTKGSRWDWTIEKATELGASRIVPVISDRTIVRIAPNEKEGKRSRWSRIAEDAARQSDAKWLPEILAPVSFAESLPLVAATKCLVGAIVDDSVPRMIGEVLHDMAVDVSRNFAVYVGPEGDFTPVELAELLKIAIPVSFGSTILRAETAAIYALSALKARLDALYACRVV